MEDTNKVLGKIFGSPARAKVLRFFMQNAPGLYTAAEVSHKTNIVPVMTVKELSALQGAGILRKRTVISRAKKTKGKKSVVWTMNEQFAYRPALEKFFADALLLDESAISKAILRVGRIKYIALSGVFVGLPEARIDMLVVGDLARPQTLARTLKTIENNICQELRLAYLTTGDFNYRRNVNDKLLRDVFDYRHRVIHDKLGHAPTAK